MAKKFVGLMAILALAGVGVGYFIYLLSNNKVTIGYNQGYKPDQPIPFSHALHAGKYKLNCKYCHTTTEVSRHATIPSLNICMNCHIQVKTDSPWIKKLQKAYYSGTSVAWQKVHLLPDFVKFNHSMHIKAGKSCDTCHGPVETMQTVYQYAPLSMGWCVNCHREPENHAPTNCSTCHY